jgi:hypothetical protein
MPLYGHCSHLLYPKAQSTPSLVQKMKVIVQKMQVKRDSLRNLERNGANGLVIFG